MANENLTSTEPQALTGKVEEILQSIRRIESELEELRSRVEEAADERPLEPLEKVTD